MVVVAALGVILTGILIESAILYASVALAAGADTRDANTFPRAFGVSFVLAIMGLALALFVAQGQFSVLVCLAIGVIAWFVVVMGSYYIGPFPAFLVFFVCLMFTIAVQVILNVVFSTDVMIESAKTILAALMSGKV
jgi:hypothetical protein